MIKAYENHFRNNLSCQFSKEEKDKKDNLKLLLNRFLSKNSSSFIQNKAIKDENNIFKSISNYLKRSIISDYNFKNNNKNVKKDTNKKYIGKIGLIPKRNYSIVNNKYASTANLKKSFILKEKMRINDSVFLPKIDIDNESKSILKDQSFKISNNNSGQLKDKQKYLSHRTNSAEILNLQFQKSSKDDKNVTQNKLILCSNAPKKKIKKMNSVLNLHRDLNMLSGEKKSSKYEENEDNRSKQSYENQNLLYSQIFKNFIIKVYKNSDSHSQQNQQKYAEKIFINKKQTKKKKKKSPNFSIKDYLNNFDPKNFIKKMKGKQINIYSKDLNEIKNKALEKTVAYIEYSVFNKNKSQKKKKDLLEKIKEKNGQLIIKYQKEFLQLKTFIKKMAIAHKMYMDILSIANNISLSTYIKLNLMRHTLTKSEKDEELYFFNMVKHLLYIEADEKYLIKDPFIKCYGDSDTHMIKKLKTLNKFLEFSNKKIYYIFFSIKFQLYDSEIKLNKYDENVKILPKNETKAKVRKKAENSNGSFRDDMDSFSAFEKRIIKKRKARRSSIIFSKYKNLSRSKLMNTNSTKYIIKSRGSNFEDILIKRNSSCLNLKQKKSNSIFEDISVKSDSNEYNNDIKSYRNNYKLKINNEKIYQRDRNLLFEHFISFAKFSEFDKLYDWLEKKWKDMDLNYKFDNGDTLLHLCVRYSVPDYVIRYLIINGININEKNEHGDTALHIAAKNHKYKIVDLLIKMGASEYINNNQQQNCWECL